MCLPPNEAFAPMPFLALPLLARAPATAGESVPLANAEEAASAIIGSQSQSVKRRWLRILLVTAGGALGLVTMGAISLMAASRQEAAQLAVMHYKDTRVKSAHCVYSEEEDKFDRILPSSGPYRSLFSQLTLNSAEGNWTGERDDDLCHKCGRQFSPTTCLGAPYLYLTFHGGSNANKVKNVCKLSRDGCSMGSVLMPSRGDEIHSLRGMLHHKGHLYVAESWRKNSRILKYSRCNPAFNHRRELLEVLVHTNELQHEGMLHPYGVAKRADDPYHIYVSAQGTSSVLRFHYCDGSPGPLPRALYSNNAGTSALPEGPAASELQGGESRRLLPDFGDQKKARALYNGTFAVRPLLTGRITGVYAQSFEKNEQVRGIAFDGQGLLYVAIEQKGVLAFNRDGFVVGQLPHNGSFPISVYYCEHRDSIWVGSRGSHTLCEYDANTWELMQVLRHNRLRHPAGFVAYGDSLFAISQEKGQLLEFSMMTGELQRVVVSDLPDAGERIALSPC